MFYWTAIRDQDYTKYTGPLPNIEACSKAVTATTASFTGEIDLGMQTAIYLTMNFK